MQKLLLTLLLTLPVASSAGNYQLEVIYPDHEVKTFVVEDSELKIPLKKSKWDCRVEAATKPVPGCVLQTISCSNGKKAADFGVVAACCPSIKGSGPKIQNVGLNIYDRGGKDSHRLTLVCTP